MELIIALIVLFFGFRLIIGIYKVLFAVIGLLLQFWIFGLAAVLVVPLMITVPTSRPQSDSRSHTTNIQAPQTYQTLPKVTTKQETTKTSATLSQWVWIGLGTVGMAVIVGGALWLNIRLQRRSENRTIQPETTVTIKQKSSKQTIIEIDGEYSDPNATEEFRAKYPFVKIEVPSRLRDAFIKECSWLEHKIGKFPSQKDQKAILQSFANKS